MALWLVVILILLSATFIMVLALGPLKAAPNARTIQVVAGLQYVAAALLVGARLLGKA